MKKRSLSLKFFLIIFVVLSILIPSLIITKVTTDKLYTSLLNSEKEVYKNATKSFVNHQSEIIRKTMQQVDIIANNPDSKNILTNADAQRRLIDLFTTIQKPNSDEYLNVFIGTSTGKLIMFPIAQIPKGYDPRKRDWYKGALNDTQKTYISELYTDIATGTTVLTVSKAITQNGQVVGVAGIDLNLTKMLEEIKSTKIGVNGYLVVLNPNGTVIMHPDKTRLNTKSVIADRLEEINKNIAGELTYTYKGEEKIAIYFKDKLTNWVYFSALNNKDILSPINKIRNNIIVVVLIIIIIAVLLSLLVSVRISYYINNIVKHMSKLAIGDFTERIKHRTLIANEINIIAEAYNKTLDALSMMLKTIKASANEVNSSAVNLSATSEEISSSINEVTEAIQQVAGGMNDQSESLSQTMQSLEEFSSGLVRLENILGGIKENTDSTLAISKQGSNMVDELSKIVEGTKQALTQMRSEINKLELKTTDIANIVQTIKSISDQTNLLSLNASIEAAKAGEYGKGFSVVAQEIRKLSEQAKQSAEQVRKLINETVETTRGVITTSEDLDEKIKTQIETVDKTTITFKDIFTTINGIAPKVNEAFDVMKSNSQANQSILANMEKITAVSQETSASSQEVAASTEEINAGAQEIASTAQELSHISNELVNEIDKFKV
ncbi:methyl-accepting chemotaxis protein [Caldicellulosiruptoraceae bacterium PP1]